MASSNAEAWARDPVADANPDLTRKRQRLSEEAEPLPVSPAESVIVEALAPDDAGSSYANAIELHDDDTTMRLFSDTLALDIHSAPIQQLETLRIELATPVYINPAYIDALTGWMENHLVSSRDLPYTILREGYAEDVDFFTKLGQVMHHLLLRDELFEDGVVSDQHELDRLNACLWLFYTALTELSIRMISILPDHIDMALARRDSGQIPKSPQRVDLIWWVFVLGQVMNVLAAPTTRFFSTSFGFKPIRFAKVEGRPRLSQPGPMKQFVRLFSKLARNHGQVDRAWQSVESLLRIVDSVDLGEGNDLINILETIHECILPVISNKHPRALPESFHETCIELATATIQRAASTGDSSIIAAIYQRLIKTGSDALLLESTEELAISDVLWNLANDDQNLLEELLSTAWALQALKSFIYSEIMDLRSIGIKLFSKWLSSLHKKYRASREQTEHPVLQYVARFLRSNELTKYIFGPNSHASLVSHSQHIISFLAATSAYTFLETDIIWHACTNSVEAEFVKASFDVLTDLFGCLETDQLVYMAQKYATTPPSKLGKDAVGSLPGLFKRLHVKETNSPVRLMTTADVAVDIMMHISCNESNPAILQLREVAKTELLRFADSMYTAGDREQIFRRCTPNLKVSSKNATTSVEILLMFLRHQLPPEEDLALHEALPLDEVIEEFGRHINSIRHSQAKSEPFSYPPIDLRLELVLRLMNVYEVSTVDNALNMLYRYAFGDLALSNGARDQAWFAMIAFLRRKDLSGATQALLERFMSNEVLATPLQFTTPRLIQILGDAQIHKSSLKEGPVVFLSSPIWQKLTQTAQSPFVPAVSRAATDMICHILFDISPDISVDQAISECHAAFTQQTVNNICRAFSQLDAAKESYSNAHVVQGLRLLDAVLHRSRHVTTVYRATPADIVLESDSIQDAWSCSLQIYPSQPTKVMRVHAARSTKLSELLVKLPTLTGAAEHRLIIAGKVLDLDADAEKSISDIDLQSSGIISVCPKYTLDSDLDVALPSFNPVEKEILAHYGQLEELLDGSNDTAEQIFAFITTIRPPAGARSRVISSPMAAIDLFPYNGTWRSSFSIFVLKNTMLNFASLGVADESFLRNGIHLLIELLCEDQPIRPVVYAQAVDCLSVFLQEQTHVLPSADTISIPARFVSRMIELCTYAVENPLGGPAVSRAVLASAAYRVLLQAFRRQPSLWKHFAEDSRITGLHSLVFLDSDGFLSEAITTAIKLFCQDPTVAAEVADFYMKICHVILPTAFSCQSRAMQFFDLATEVLLANRMLTSDETKAREIVTSLISALESYEHNESIDFPVADVGMIGLLKLLHAAMRILKSFKKPLHLTNLSTTLLNGLLFPPMKDFASRPLVFRQSRRLTYALIRTACESAADLKNLLSVIRVPLNEANSDPTAKYPGHSQWLRPASRCSGLVNLGMTCYMNSLLQQLFANVQFRKFILEVPLVNSAEQKILSAVQTLFAHMQDEYNLSIDTSRLAQELNIQTDSQEDVHGFYADFLNKLDANMPDESSRRSLAKFYSGKFISQIKGECGHVSPKTETFVDLPIIVKNKASLKDSLDEFVQGEPMEGTNQYKCMACDPADGGRLVNAMKRACLEELPDNLTFCLKRFTWEAMLGFDGKVNDRFEFPSTIDMSRYHRQHLEDPGMSVDEDQFELVGVIVHQGTLNLGHYWSYTLLRNTAHLENPSWIKLEDKSVSLCPGGIDEVQRECFGGLRYANGNERADNAYVLFYQRKSSLVDQDALREPSPDPTSHAILPPRVSIPPSLATEVHNVNAWRYLIANLFDDDFAQFTSWLFERYRDSRLDSQGLSVSDHENGTSSPEDVWPSTDDGSQDDLLHDMSEISMLYVQRIAVCDPAYSKKLQPYVTKLHSHLPEAPKTAALYLNQILGEEDWFKRLIVHESKPARSTLLYFILNCLDCLREQDNAAYDEAFHKIRLIHSSQMSPVQNLTQLDWTDYLDFAAMLARPGPYETAAVLDSGYLRWAFEMLFLPFESPMKKRSQVLLEHMRHNPGKVSALYEFIFAILDGHVDIPDTLDLPQASNILNHEVTESGARLQNDEVAYFLKGIRGIPVWMSSARYATAVSDWEDYSPGRLLGLLMRKTPVLAQAIPQLMALYIELEEERLHNMLLLALHFCANCEHPEQAAPVVRATASTIVLWGKPEEFFSFLHRALKMVPVPILDTTPLWAAQLLSSKYSSISAAAAKWLCEEVFASDPVTEVSAADTSRARLARKLAEQTYNVVKVAYDHEQPRRRFEARLQVVLAAARYLDALQRRVNDLLKHDDDAEVRACVSRELQVENDESRVIVNRLEGLVQLADEWEDEEMPSRGLYGVRRSVEEASESLETSEDEWDDNDSLSMN